MQLYKNRIKKIYIIARTRCETRFILKRREGNFRLSAGEGISIWGGTDKTRLKENIKSFK